MILNELVLHNVGTFAGRQTLDLRPGGQGRPIVLIGGMNGAGKTTLLEAVHLALYGSLVQGSRRQSGSYETYLRSLVHRGVPLSEGAAVELSFQANREGLQQNFRIRRSWRDSGRAVRERVEVFVDGRPDSLLTSTWAEYFETFLPRGVSGLFFFDGEQIEALADLERSQQVLGSALRSLLGLDLVERLSTDLAVLRRRHRTRHMTTELREQVDNRHRAVTERRQAEEEASRFVAVGRGEVERAHKLLFEAEERYRSAGGELLEQHDAIEQRLAHLHEETEQVDDELRELAAGAAPLLLLGEQLRTVAERSRLEMTAARDAVVLDVVRERDAAVIAQLQGEKVRISVLRTVERFLESDRERRQATAAIIPITDLSDAASVEYLLAAGLPDVTRRVQALLDRRVKMREERDRVERILAAIPDAEALAPLALGVENGRSELLRAEASLAHAEERLSSARQERERADAVYEKAMDAAAAESLSADDDRRVVDHVDRVRSTLESLRVAATERQLDRISRFVMDALGQLLRKDSLITGIEIDPETYEVRLFGDRGVALPTQELSAGERQLLAVALLWGLAQASGQPLPIMIDTPLGRLDSAHREHLLDRYFPQASHQVILLSTDTEIEAEDYRRVKRHVGRSYRLDFNTETNATTVQSGFFWDE